MTRGPFTLMLKGKARVASFFNTRAARECTRLAPDAWLTGTGHIDNIRRDRDAIRVGSKSVISGHLQTFAHAGKITIGDWVFIGEGSRVWSAAVVSIGDRVLISHHANIIDTSSHPIDVHARFVQTKAILTSGHPVSDPGLDSAPITICDDAWISFGASVLKGVTIGEGAIVGACSVVTKDVAPWTVVAGNPARLIRQLEPGAPRDAIAGS